MWVEFVVGSLLCSERFFSGYAGIPLSSKTNLSKFNLILECTATCISERVLANFLVFRG